MFAITTRSLQRPVSPSWAEALLRIACTGQLESANDCLMRFPGGDFASFRRAEPIHLARRNQRHECPRQSRQVPLPRRRRRALGPLIQRKGNRRTNFKLIIVHTACTQSLAGSTDCPIKLAQSVSASTDPSESVAQHTKKTFTRSRRVSDEGASARGRRSGK